MNKTKLATAAVFLGAAIIGSVAASSGVFAQNLNGSSGSSGSYNSMTGTSSETNANGTSGINGNGTTSTTPGLPNTGEKYGG